MPYKLTPMQWKMVARLHSDGENSGCPPGVGKKTLDECLKLGYVEWWTKSSVTFSRQYLRRTALGEQLLQHDFALGRRDPLAP